MGLSGGSGTELMLAGIACALVNGNVFTAERMDRSAQFLDYLPPTRRQILLSKLLVVVGFTLMVIVIALSAVLLAWSLAVVYLYPRKQTHSDKNGS